MLSLENNGYLVYEGIEKDFSNEIALEIDEMVDDVESLLTFLMNHRMIEVTNDNDYFLNRIPEMTTKETGAAKRMRICRQKKKELICNNVTPMLQAVTERYTEIEKESEQEQEKDIKPKKEMKEYINLGNEIEVVKLTKEQFDKLIERYGDVATIKMIDKMDNYCCSKGTKYKDYYKTAFSWFSKEEEKKPVIKKENLTADGFIIPDYVLQNPSRYQYDGKGYATDLNNGTQKKFSKAV